MVVVAAPNIEKTTSDIKLDYWSNVIQHLWSNNCLIIGLTLFLDIFAKVPILLTNVGPIKWVGIQYWLKKGFSNFDKT